MKPPPLIPGLEFLRPVGRGAYGQVWLVRSDDGKFHAVKIVSRSDFDDPRPFEREAQALERCANLTRSTPELLPILRHALSADGECLYYEMALADDLENGRAIDPVTYQPCSLRLVLRRDKRLPLSGCLALARSAAKALAAIHAAGLVHRDVKPANILYFHGQPVLADIGLADRPSASLTLVGTEGYLPARGAGKHSADFYSLGMVIYESMTGRSRREFPSLPPDVGTGPDAVRSLALNQIILRACAPRPSARYADAGQFLHDLHRADIGQRIRPRLNPFLGMAVLAVLLVVLLLIAKAVMPATPHHRAEVLRGFDPAEHTAWTRRNIAPRPKQASANQLDLTDFYNASLDRSSVPVANDWEAENNGFPHLPRGLAILDGTAFDIRGVIQLDGAIARARTGEILPERVGNIPVGRKFRLLHVLGYTSWACEHPGPEAARIKLCLSDGSQETLRLRFGIELDGSWQPPDRSVTNLPNSRLAWRGTNAAAAAWPITVWHTALTNHASEQVVLSLDLESSMCPAAPAFIALTVE